MSIFKKSMSITRFKVVGDPQVDGQSISDTILAGLENNQIIDIEQGEEMSWGWTKLTDPLSPEFNDMSFMTGNYMTVALRLDKKSVPGAAVKRAIYFAEKKEKEEKQVPKLARATRVMIKEAVVKNLLAKAPIVTQTADVIWNIDGQTLYFFSTNKLAREIIENVFKDTFNVTLEMMFPFTMGLETVDEDTLAATTPTLFV